MRPSQRCSSLCGESLKVCWNRRQTLVRGRVPGCVKVKEMPTRGRRCRTDVPEFPGGGEVTRLHRRLPRTAAWMAVGDCPPVSTGLPADEVTSSSLSQVRPKLGPALPSVSFQQISIPCATLKAHKLTAPASSTSSASDARPRSLWARSQRTPS